MHWYYAIGARGRFAEFRHRLAEREVSVAHGGMERHRDGSGGLAWYNVQVPASGRAATSLGGSQGHDVPQLTIAHRPDLMGRP